MNTRFFLLSVLGGLLLSATCPAQDYSQLKLDETHLLLNAYATPEELQSPYVAATLQTLGELSADRRTLTLPAGTTVYIAPGVYWTDETYRQGFPFDDSGFVIAPPNVGLTVLGDNISFIGLSGDPDDVRIAGNRGEGGAKGLGAGGSWYTLAVSTGFRAENITIANYAQEDLVYLPDPSQNISKRIDSKNHAEVLTGASRGIDRMEFRNVRFVGYLNMMAGFSPRRAYFKDCFFQCTDDSIFGGGVNVYENCTFHHFGNHPTWSGAAAGGINALLGCRLVGMPQMTQTVLSMAKNAAPGNGAQASAIYAVIDCQFLGRIAAVEWENHVREDARYAVHGNTIGPGRRPLVISEAAPQLSVDYGGEALKAFKVGDEYNVYNLLKGDDGWDPKGQYRAEWAPYANLPYRFLVGYTGKVLDSAASDGTNTVELSAAPVPVSSVDLREIRWEYDTALLEGTSDPAAGTLTLHARPNRSGSIVETLVEGVLPNGVRAGVTLRIRPVPVAAPKLRAPAVTIAGGCAQLSYRLDKPAFRDVSRIEWYREAGPGRTDGVHIGTTRNDDEGLFVDDPFKSLTLTKYDVGCWLRAVITPKYAFSAYAPASVTVYSKRAVRAEDIDGTALETDFKNVYIATEPRSATVGRWFYDNETGTPDPWLWGVGSNGSDGRWGLCNNMRQPEPPLLVFAQEGVYGDMSFTVDYSSSKVEGQGFGGSGCYLDVLVKYDPATRSGYGVRVERVPATTNGTQWTLYRFAGNEKTALTGGVLAATFMPQSTMTVSVEGNTLHLTAGTASERTPLQVYEDLPAQLDLRWTDPSGALGRNGFGGAAFRIYNSGTPGYRYNAASNNCVMLHRVRLDAAENR
ncbi:MAG: hypothetical protein K5849_04035 [Bacteroidales bacterium]|nr:hypothetical protein [Bacteroidales bacterium]